MADTINLFRQIDKAVASGIIQRSDTDYDMIYSRAGAECREENMESWILNELSNVWMDAYNEMIQTSNEIIEISVDHCRCIFDYSYQRVVCFFGLSQPTKDDRDRNRQAGFIPGFANHYHGKDRGHFLSHGQGGGMDINLFPQEKEINRGWSGAGKIYRKMERFCSKNPGIFCFSRPLYEPDNATWDPERIEYGIADHGQYRIVVFPN